MNKAYEDVEDDLDDNFWHATLLAHLGREVLDNAESECVKAACRGETALVDVLNDEIERQKRIDVEIEKDPDSEVPEMQTYLQIAVDIDGIEPPLEWAAKVKRFNIERSRKSGVVKARRTVCVSRRSVY